MKNTKLIGLLVGSAIALALISNFARGEEEAAAVGEWGDTVYAGNTAPEPKVEAALDSEIVEMPPMADAPAPRAKSRVESEEIMTTQSGAESRTENRSANSKVKTSNISTAEDTFGVATEERQSPAFYASPFAGYSSPIGNDSADSEPKFTLGAKLGLLISNNMLVEIGYTRAETNFSNPRIRPNIYSYGLAGASVFNLTQNIFSGGARFFILGRDSRVRPFMGGGASYSREYLNYTTAYAQASNNSTQFTSDLILNQFRGYGEIGAEVAITRTIVASASFQFNGVISSGTNGTYADSNSVYDASRADVANSLSRTASYLISGGVGIYF